MTGTVQERLAGVVADQLSVERKVVTPGANLKDDLNADSLDLVELIMAIEEEFSIEIPDEDAEKIATVGDAISYIERNMKK